MNEVKPMNKVEIYEKGKNVGKLIAYNDVLNEVNEWTKCCIEAGCSITQTIPLFDLAHYIINKADEIH